MAAVSDIATENKVYWTNRDGVSSICDFREIVSVYVGDSGGILDVELDGIRGRWYQMNDAVCMPEKCSVIYNGREYTGLDGFRQLRQYIERKKIERLLEAMP